MKTNINLLNEAFEKAMALVNERNEKLKAVEADTSELEKQIASFSEELNSALDAGNYELYEAAIKAKGKAEFQLAFANSRKAELKKPQSISDFTEVWKEFSKTYESVFQLILKDYLDLRHELYERFTILADMQAKAGSLRYQIGKACGYADTYMIDTDATTYAAIGNFTTLPTKPARSVPIRHAPDAAFFIATGEAPAEKDNYLFNTFIQKK